MENVHVRIGRLSDKYCRHGQINRGAVQVKGVTGGDHQPYYRFLAAQLLHLIQHARQRRLGRRSAQHNQQLFFDIGDELKDAESGEQACNQPQHDHHKQNTGDVEADNQLAELHQ